MDNLPTEICAQICEHVASNIDLKSLSLLNRKWAAVTRPRLFQCIHVIPWRQSLARLEQSLEQPIVQIHARELHLSIPHMATIPTSDHYRRLVKGFTGKESWLDDHRTQAQDDEAAAAAQKRRDWEPTEEFWRDYLTGQGPSLSELGMDYDDIGPKIVQMPYREDWGYLEEQYRKEAAEYTEGLTRLQEGPIWKTIKRAVGRPFTTVTVSGRDVWTGYTNVWKLMERTRQARIHNNFGKIASSMLRDGIFHEVQEVALGLLMPDTLSVKCPPDIKLPTELVKTADRVLLTFSPPAHLQYSTMDEEERASYRYNFSGSNILVDYTKEDLKELHVQFYAPKPGVSLIADIPVGPAYDCHTLRSLSLGGFSLPLGALQGMLDNVRGTLESLELRDILMTSYDDKVPDQETTPEGFLHALVEHHRLKKACFAEWFGMDKTKYNMNIALRKGPLESFFTFESSHEDELVRVGEQIARAVVMEPEHRCFWDDWDKRLGLDRRILPTKQERHAWLHKMFEKLEELHYRR